MIPLYISRSERFRKHPNVLEVWRPRVSHCIFGDTCSWKEREVGNFEMKLERMKSEGSYHLQRNFQKKISNCAQFFPTSDFSTPRSFKLPFSITVIPICGRSVWLHDPILIGECMWFFSGNEHFRDFSHVSKVSRIESRFASGWETIILRPKSVIYKVIFLWNYISPTRKLSKNYSSYNGTSITGVHYKRMRFNQWFTYESYLRYIWVI